MKTFCGSLDENGPHRLVVWMLGAQLMAICEWLGGEVVLEEMHGW